MKRATSYLLIFLNSLIYILPAEAVITPTANQKETQISAVYNPDSDRAAEERVDSLNAAQDAAAVMAASVVSEEAKAALEAPVSKPEASQGVSPEAAAFLTAFLEDPEKYFADNPQALLVLVTTMIEAKVDMKEYGPVLEQAAKDGVVKPVIAQAVFKVLESENYWPKVMADVAKEAGADFEKAFGLKLSDYGEGKFGKLLDDIRAKLDAERGAKRGDMELAAAKLLVTFHYFIFNYDAKVGDAVDGLGARQFKGSCQASSMLYAYLFARAGINFAAVTGKTPDEYHRYGFIETADGRRAIVDMNIFHVIVDSDKFDDKEGNLTVTSDISFPKGDRRETHQQTYIRSYNRIYRNAGKTGALVFDAVMRDIKAALRASEAASKIADVADRIKANEEVAATIAAALRNLPGITMHEIILTVPSITSTFGGQTQRVTIQTPHVFLAIVYAQLAVDNLQLRTKDGAKKAVGYLNEALKILPEGYLSGLQGRDGKNLTLKDVLAIANGASGKESTAPAVTLDARNKPAGEFVVIGAAAAPKGGNPAADSMKDFNDAMTNHDQFVKDFQAKVDANLNKNNKTALEEAEKLVPVMAATLAKLNAALDRFKDKKDDEKSGITPRGKNELTVGEWRKIIRDRIKEIQDQKADFERIIADLKKALGGVSAAPAPAADLGLVDARVNTTVSMPVPQPVMAAPSTTLIVSAAETAYGTDEYACFINPDDFESAEGASLVSFDGGEDALTTYAIV